MKMAFRAAAGDAAADMRAAGLDAFFRHRPDVPGACHAALIRSLSRVRASDDPVVTFGQLPRACVPDFADGCQVEVADGVQPIFRAACPTSTADGFEPASRHQADPDQVISIPFRVVSPVGHGSYAGVVTYWWTGRAPSGSDAVIADLLVKLVVALVEQERLMVAVRRAEDRAARLAVEAISGRAIHLAAGVVMHQEGLAADNAEDLLREAAKLTGNDLYQVAASVVRARRFLIRLLAAAPARPPSP
jgi:hypothetical protein